MYYLIYVRTIGLRKNPNNISISKIRIELVNYLAGFSTIYLSILEFIAFLTSSQFLSSLLMYANTARACQDKFYRAF